MSQIERDIKDIEESIAFLKSEKQRIEFEQCFAGDSYFDTGFGSEIIMYDKRLAEASNLADIAELDRQIAIFQKMLDEKNAEKNQPQRLA